MTATTWLDVGGEIAASFAKRIVAMAMPEHATAFSSTQVDLVQELFEGALIGLAEILAARLSSIDANKSILEHGILSQNGVATVSREF